MSGKKTFCVTVARTVTYVNDVYVDANDPEDAMESLRDQIWARDFSWFDPVSWGEAFYYEVEKQLPDRDEFHVESAEVEEDSALGMETHEERRT